jgi:signal transduction histidine kinase
MARLLVVDDNAANRELLCAYLAADGHEIVEASSGDEALALAAAPDARLDLVLLDIMMPGLNGFETAVRLKRDAGEQFLPVLLVSSLSDPSSRVLGLKVGADDFLTKPIDRSELRARVNNLLALRNKERELATRNRELLELERFRDEMSALLVHDLKNPISIVLANLEFVLESPRLDEEEREALADARLAGDRTLRLVANLLDVARSNAGRLELKRAPHKLAAVVSSVAERYRRVAEPRGITIEQAVALELEAPIDAELVTRVVENIFDNSLRYTPAGGRVRVDAERRGARVRLRIGNSGPPIPVEARERIFDKFAQADWRLRRSNIGLGLYFCRLVAEAHGGSIKVEEDPELPTLFVIDLQA